MHKIKEVALILQGVFNSWQYRILAISGAVLFLLLEIWLAHYSLIRFTLQTNAFSWEDRVHVLWSTVEMFFTIFPWDTRLLAVVTALFVGLNITVLVYYVRRQAKVLRTSGASALGIMISILGVGCSACGLVVLSSFVGFASATRILTVLPLRGKEFGFLSIVIFIASTYWILKKLANPPACRMK